MPTRPRTRRRAISRDLARTRPAPRQLPSHGAIADIIRTGTFLRTVVPSSRSGQLRIDVKRSRRAEFWRAVKVLMSPEVEPHFREHLGLLGEGARIQGRTQVDFGFGPAVDLDVHIPTAPAAAARAEPMFLGVWNGDLHVPALDYVRWFDAHGNELADEPLTRRW